MPRRIAQRPGQHVAVEPAENQRGQFLGDARIAPAMGHLFLAAPGQQRFKFGRRAVGSSVGQAMLSAGQSHGHGLQTGAGRIDPPHQHLLDRDVLPPAWKRCWLSTG